MDIEHHYRRDDRGTTVHFSLSLPATPRVVWAALTEPEQLTQWLARAAFDAVRGGAVHLTWPGGEEIHGEVLRADPPNRLRYSWRESVTTSEVEWLIEPRTADTSELTLDHRATTEENAPGVGARWHAHLESLHDLLTGAATSHDARDKRFHELQETYRQRFTP